MDKMNLFWLVRPFKSVNSLKPHQKHKPGLPAAKTVAQPHPAHPVKVDRDNAPKERLKHKQVAPVDKMVALPVASRPVVAPADRVVASVILLGITKLAAL